MRVICINDRCVFQRKVVLLVKGNIYHVIEERDVDGKTSDGEICVPGVYYKLIETDNWYHNSLFLKVNDNQIDEMEYSLVEVNTEVLNQPPLNR